MSLPHLNFYDTIDTLWTFFSHWFIIQLFYSMGRGVTERMTKDKYDFPIIEKAKTYAVCFGIAIIVSIIYTFLKTGSDYDFQHMLNVFVSFMACSSVGVFRKYLELEE